MNDYTPPTRRVRPDDPDLIIRNPTSRRWVVLAGVGCVRNVKAAFDTAQEAIEASNWSPEKRAAGLVKAAAL